MKQRNSGRVVVLTGAGTDVVASIADRFAAGMYTVSTSSNSKDPLVDETVRALAGAGEVDDLYGAAAEAFLTMYLLTRHGRLSAARMSARENARLGAVAETVRGLLADSITMPHAGGRVHLSVPHLVELFQEATGVSPARYLTRLRVDEARRLLRDTELSVAEIAGRCGFAGPGALSAVFVRHTGVRPSVYRCG